MKTKLLFTTLLSFYFYLLSSQVPQGFNYQAIARDGSGNPITGATIKVKLSILTDSTNFFTAGGSPANYIWEEEHTNVKTNAFGLFTIVLGNPLATKVQGTAASFSSIPWSQSPLYVGTKIANPTTYKIMGSARLWSVPYSMIAGDLEGSVKKLAVVGEDVLSDEALFEVKRKDGETMFAVYNHGVRVFMPLDTISKSRKGGFAIGGFDKTKGTTTFQDYFVVNPDSIRAYIDTNPVKARKGGFAIGGFDKTKAGNEEYLRVTRDSTRIYLNDTGTKARKGGFAIGGFDKTKGGIQDFLTVSTDSIRMFIDDTPVKARKGGFAIGGFDKTKAGNTSFLNVATDESGIINPSQNRILWYPLRNAFLTGKVLIEKPDSVGVNSFASGYESKAKGQYSQALGYKAIARGDYSTAIGKNAIASKTNSFALGDGAQVLTQDSYAFGAGATAKGIGSYAFGSAGRDTSGALTGLMTTASGDYSIAIGQGAIASNLTSFAIGTNTTASGNSSTALGYKSSANGDLSTALGYNNKANGFLSTSIGSSNVASGNYSIVMGFSSVAAGDYSTAIGWLNEATGLISTTLGGLNVASGVASTATGYATIASGHNSTSMGTYTKASASCSVAMGSSTTASGQLSLAMGRYTIASGFNSTSMGDGTIAKMSGSTAMGYNTIAAHNYSLVIGTYNDTIHVRDYYGDSDPLFIIGNGLSASDRKNAFSVYKNGFADLSGMLRVQGDNLPISGTGVEIFLQRSTGNGVIQCYDRAAHAYKELIINASGIEPIADNLYNIGSSSLRWAAIYAANGTIQTSDRRMKDNIYSLTGGLETILKLNPIYFTWKNNSDKRKHLGLIAQEVLPVIPEIVDIGDDPDKTLGLNYTGLVPILVNAIQEQQALIKTLQSNNEELRELNNSIIQKQDTQQKEIDDLRTVVKTLIARQKEQLNN